MFTQCFTNDVHSTRFITVGLLATSVERCPEIKNVLFPARKVMLGAVPQRRRLLVVRHLT